MIEEKLDIRKVVQGLILRQCILTGCGQEELQ